MSLSINQIVDVQLIDSPMGLAMRDFSLSLILTSSKGDIFGTSQDRTFFAASADEVGKHFGTESEVYKAARMYFSVTPKPKRVLIGYWDKGEAEQPTESITDALIAINDKNQNFYGLYISDKVEDKVADEAHEWVASQVIPRVMAYTALRDEQIEDTEENIIKKWADKNTGRVMVLFNKTGDDHGAAQLLAMAINTNWRGYNTAKTLKFKTMTVRSDANISLNDAEKCRKLGVTFYTDYDGMSMVAEGTMVGGRWIDEIVGLDAFINAIQVETVNALRTYPKIAQTDRGTEILIGRLVPIARQFVNNGFMAGGKWNGVEIGELMAGDMLHDGFYFYADSFANQTQADRDERLGMPITVAIKLAGAIHNQDILVNFNR
ncbi:hypothetical protein [Proteus phage vB_PmiP_RS51pmB]|nr:hypothetical protein [Proteus phage vB_PmiP_RS51pmB]